MKNRMSSRYVCVCEQGQECMVHSVEERRLAAMALITPKGEVIMTQQLPPPPTSANMPIYANKKCRIFHNYSAWAYGGPHSHMRHKRCSHCGYIKYKAYKSSDFEIQALQLYRVNDDLMTRNDELSTALKGMINSSDATGIWSSAWKDQYDRAVRVVKKG